MDMDINFLTIGQAKELAAMFPVVDPVQQQSFMETGKNYIIRTVTMTFTGRVTRQSATEIELERAAWIADSGRWANCLKDGAEALSEVEPYKNPVVVMRQVIVDYTPWEGSLPEAQK